jgi:hypothetical protein
MASQAVDELLEELPAADGRLQVRLRLICGCEIEKTVAGDRVITTVDGLRLAVGKYSCPLDHPVVRRK